MKVITYEVQAEGFSGEVVLSVPNYKERLAIIKEMGIKVTAEGAVGGELMDKVEVMHDKLKSLVKSVNLSYGDHAFTSMEELEYYEEGVGVIQELGLLLMKGLSLGKS